MLYAACSRTMDVSSVQVPNVRAERGVTWEGVSVDLRVRGGTPEGDGGERGV